ncbi:MAG: LysR family transcriptional regulator [Clostridiales bacterium]|nr:LysR family transcriptional regulator [Candidatus Coliplasma caballi]
MINKKIDYFLTLAECLNFTQAAAKHSVSQTAISQYIAALEDKLGVRLFKRSSHSVSLTEAGKYYYQQVRYIRELYDDTEKHVRAIDERYSGYLKVGIGLYEYCNTESFFGSFLKENPEIKVDIFQYEYSELSEKLKAGQLDVIVAAQFCEQAFEKEGFRSRTLFESPNFLVASKDVAAKYKGKSPADILKGEYLITNCEDNGPSSMEFLRKTLLEEFGFSTSRVVQTNSIGAQLLMVRSGHGVALVPGFLKELNDEEFVCFPLSNKVMRYDLIVLPGNDNPVAEKIMAFGKE